MSNSRRYGGKHPWFLVSGGLMLVGCYLVNAAVHDRPDELGPVLALAGVLLAYQWLVLGLGVWLWRRGTGVREAKHLLGLAVLLMADTTLVFNELAIAHLGWGTAIGGLAAVVAVAQAGIVARISGLRLGLGGWVSCVCGVVGAFGLPLLARAAWGSGGLPGWWLTGAWWAAAVLIAVSLWAWSDPRAGQERCRRLRAMLILLPSGSAVMHLLAIHWVYNETWTAAHLSPVLLGLSVVLLLRSPWAVTPRVAAVLAGLVGGIAAGSGSMSAAYSGVNGEVMTIDWGVVRFEWSVLRMWLVVAGVAYAGVWWRQRSLWLLPVWPALFLIAIGGASPGRIVDRGVWLCERVRAGIDVVLPSGLLSWGVMIMVLAFATLGLEAWLSGRRRPSADS
ncbi:MAG: hypothetical protein AAGH99_00545 [Planctomycetota bacterium]